MLSIKDRLERLAVLEKENAKLREGLEECFDLLSHMQGSLPRLNCMGEPVTHADVVSDHVCACTGNCQPFHSEITNLHNKIFS